MWPRTGRPEVRPARLAPVPAPSRPADARADPSLPGVGGRRFVDSYLYDGGFGDVSTSSTQAPGASSTGLPPTACSSYQWLFGHDNNYSWYHPATTRSSTSSTRYPVPARQTRRGRPWRPLRVLRRRNRPGPARPVLHAARRGPFMLGRAGFSSPEGSSDLEGDERKPRQILDFATGSGGFVVEAARRIIDEGGIHEDDAEADRGARGDRQRHPRLRDQPLPLLPDRDQPAAAGVARARRDHARRTDAAGTFVSSASCTPTRSPLADSAPRASRGSHQTSAPTTRSSLAMTFRTCRRSTPRSRLHSTGFARRRFDLVVGNPPYVFETNNRLLFDRLRRIPAWKDMYKGKSDYLYYFLLLAVEKLAPGGRLCVITPAGWMNAGNADWLRERLAVRLHSTSSTCSGATGCSRRGSARRRHRAPTPTVESAILIATKAKRRRAQAPDRGAGGRERSAEALGIRTMTLAGPRLLDEMEKRGGGGGPKRRDSRPRRCTGDLVPTALADQARREGPRGPGGRAPAGPARSVKHPS